MSEKVLHRFAMFSTEPDQSSCEYQIGTAQVLLLDGQLGAAKATKDDQCREHGQRGPQRHGVAEQAECNQQPENIQDQGRQTAVAGHARQRI